MAYRLSDLRYSTPGAAVPGGAVADDWFASQGAPSGPAAPGPGAGLSPELYFQQLIQGKPGTPETLISLEPQLNQAGIQVMRNAAGTAGKIKLPNGQIVDVIRAAGTGGGADNWQWLTGGGPAAGGIGTGLETSPGYQFRLGEGVKALERSAAARGTLLTGGALKGLERYAQDYASNEYGTRVNQLMGLSNMGLNAAGGAANAGSSYANQASELNAQIGNAQAAGTVGAANAWQQPINQATNLAQMYFLSRLMKPGTPTV